MAAQVDLFHDFDDVERDAAGALDRERRTSTFERLGWFRLVQQYTPAGKLLAVRARNGVAQGWLFLGVKGGEAVALANWYSLRFGPVVDGGAAESVFDALARGLRAGGVRRLSLSPMEADQRLEAALRRRGWFVRRAKSTVNWRIRTAGLTFEDYWASRPSRLRNTAKRRAKAAALSIRILDRFDPDAWRDYESVYSNSWKPSEGSPELMRAFAEQEGAAGTLRIGLAYREGTPVAAQLWTVENKAATIHKLAYREDAKEHSPGTLLSVEMFRRAIDMDRVEAIDFGIGDDPYKAEWMEEAEPLYRLTAFDMRSPGGLAAMAAVLGSKLVARLRSR